MRRVAALAVAIALAVAACSSDDDARAGTPTTSAPATSASPTTEQVLTPDGEWESVAPASAGLDAEKLEALAETARVGKSNCLVVVRDGKLVGEWYFNGTDASTAQEVFSATKSVTSTLVGLAVDAGKASLDDRATTWIPEWKGTPSEVVTLRDLLSNDSGRDWSLAEDYVELLRAPDKTAFAVGLGQAVAPHQTWAYNNSAIQTLERVVSGTLGDVAEQARRRLFAPLGMNDTELTTDPSGHALMFMGVRSSCRDMARFGALFLAEGNWNGEQLLSRRWVRQATGRSSTELNAAYGFLWWLNRPGVLASPLAPVSIDAVDDGTVTDGQMVPGAPDDMFWALGLGNQVVQVDPGTRTVVVRLGTAERNPTPPTFGTAEASRVVTEAVRHTK